MIGSPAKRLGVALLGTALIAGALFIAATGERADVGAALLGILPFGLGMLMFAAAKRPAPGSRSGMDIRLVDGHSATVFAISVGRALLFRRGAVGEIILSLGGLDLRGGSEGTAAPWDAVREVSEAIVRWCREDRLRSDPR